MSGQRTHFDILEAKLETRFDSIPDNIKSELKTESAKASEQLNIDPSEYLTFLYQLYTASEDEQSTLDEVDWLKYAKTLAMKLVLAFGNVAASKNYINRYSSIDAAKPAYEQSRQLIHDACLFSLPDNSNWDRTHWQKMLIAAKPNGPEDEIMRLLPLADRIEAYILNPDNLTLITQIVEDENKKNAIIKYKQEYKNILANQKRKLEKEQLEKEHAKKVEYSQNISEIEESKLDQGNVNLHSEKKEIKKEKAKKAKSKEKNEDDNDLINAHRSEEAYIAYKLNKDKVKSELPLKKIRGIKLADLALPTLKKISKNCLYKNAQLNPEAAALFFSHNIPEDKFDLYLSLTPNTSHEFIPNVTINGKEIKDGYKDFVISKLDSRNPEAAILGKLTSCCQWLGGAGESCAIHGITDPRGGFYVLRNQETNAVIAQCWAWSDAQGNIVFDSIEIALNSRVKHKTMIIDFFSHLASQLTTQPNVNSVLVGLGGETPIELKGLSPIDACKPMNYDGYRDSKAQAILSLGCDLLRGINTYEFVVFLRSLKDFDLKAQFLNVIGTEKLQMLFKEKDKELSGLVIGLEEREQFELLDVLGGPGIAAVFKNNTDSFRMFLAISNSIMKKCIAMMGREGLCALYQTSVNFATDLYLLDPETRMEVIRTLGPDLNTVLNSDLAIESFLVYFNADKHFPEIASQLQLNVTQAVTVVNKLYHRLNPKNAYLLLEKVAEQFPQDPQIGFVFYMQGRMCDKYESYKPIVLNRYEKAYAHLNLSQGASSFLANCNMIGINGNYLILDLLTTYSNLASHFLNKYDLDNSKLCIERASECNEHLNHDDKAIAHLKQTINNVRSQLLMTKSNLSYYQDIFFGSGQPNSNQNAKQETAKAMEHHVVKSNSTGTKKSSFAKPLASVITSPPKTKTLRTESPSKTINTKNSTTSKVKVIESPSKTINTKNTTTSKVKVDVKQIHKALKTTVSVKSDKVIRATKNAENADSSVNNTNTTNSAQIKNNPTMTNVNLPQQQTKIPKPPANYSRNKSIFSEKTQIPRLKSRLLEKKKASVSVKKKQT